MMLEKGGSWGHSSTAEGSPQRHVWARPTNYSGMSGACSPDPSPACAYKVKKGTILWFVCNCFSLLNFLCTSERQLNQQKKIINCQSIYIFINLLIKTDFCQKLKIKQVQITSSVKSQEVIYLSVQVHFIYWFIKWLPGCGGTRLYLTPPPHPRTECQIETDGLCELKVCSPQGDLASSFQMWAMTFR